MDRRADTVDPKRPALSGLLVLITCGILLCAASTASAAPAGRTLRVCSDPNNLPFSNNRGEGLENALANLIASDMHARVEYTWWAQRRGFIRNTLKANRCDVVMGIPSSFEQVLPTAPYYRSSYVFVSRKDRHLKVRSFDDPILRKLRIGVPLVSDDGANAPPMQALANRGIINQVKGYSVYGDYSQPNPPARIMEGLARGDIDLAIAWGPLAGYFARQSKVPMDIVPVSPQIDLPFLPFVFDISVGVRRGDNALRDEIDDILQRRRADVGKILSRFGVPLVGGSGS